MECIKCWKWPLTWAGTGWWHVMRKFGEKVLPQILRHQIWVTKTVLFFSTFLSGGSLAEDYSCRIFKIPQWMHYLNANSTQMLSKEQITVCKIEQYFTFRLQDVLLLVLNCNPHCHNCNRPEYSKNIWTKRKCLHVFIFYLHIMMTPIPCFQDHDPVLNNRHGKWVDNMFLLDLSK